jgi:hypothetical protein
MSRTYALPSIVALLMTIAGCHTTVVTGPGPGTDTPVTLGSLGEGGYHISAGATALIPSGDIGFVITANGQGDYSIRWTDTVGTLAQFAGSISTDGKFAQPTYTNSSNTVLVSEQANVIQFTSTPQNSVDGVDIFTNTEPIYLDLTVQGSHTGFGIYFTGAYSGALIDSQLNPVAFTSP